METTGKDGAVSNDSLPFGRYRPRAILAWMLGVTRRRRDGWLAQRMVFAYRTAAIMLLKGEPLDVETLGTRMRLYPAHNISEKNLLFTPHLFDPEERRELASRIGEGFTFVDVGANVGGYSLFVAASGGGGMRILAVEPQPDVFERLVYNIDENAFASIKAIDCAVADRDGDVTLFLDPSNRGQASMRFVNSQPDAQQIIVPGKSLVTILSEEGLTRLDALKVDVEGAEDIVLSAFFRDADPKLWPHLLIVDGTPEALAAEIPQLGEAGAYRLVLRTRSNSLYERADLSLS